MIKELLPLLNIVKLIDKVLVAQLEHPVERCEEISLAHFHDWILREHILVFTLLTLFENQRLQRSYISAHLAWNECSYSLVC